MLCQDDDEGDGEGDHAIRLFISCKDKLINQEEEKGHQIETTIGD